MRKWKETVGPVCSITARENSSSTVTVTSCNPRGAEERKDRMDGMEVLYSRYVRCTRAELKRDRMEEAAVDISSA